MEQKGTMDKKRILIVDDDKNHRQVLKSMLACEGYDIIEATDGEDAIRQAKELTPDLILMDILMPKMDGLAAAKEIQKNSGTSKFIPIILISIANTKENISKSLKIGISGFITKPYTKAEVHNKIKEVLKMSMTI